MTIYSPLAFIFAIFLPLIVILYLLKQQHQDYPISSIMLWQQALKDIEANAPWQKLRNNLLMMLQLLLMLLLIFALAKPFIQTKGTISQELILVLDVSASMQAKDIAPNRFEAAKKELLRVVGSSNPNTRFTVISMGPKAKIEINKSSDKGSVIEEVKKIAVTNGVANVQEARTIIQSIKSESVNAQAILFGDNYYEDFKDIKFVSVAGNNDNTAIILLSYTQQGDKIIGLSRAANYSSAEKSLSLVLYGDEQVIDAKDITLQPGEVKDVYWSSIPLDIAMLSCEIENADDIDYDNIARTVISKQKNRKILLVTERNVFLEKALMLIPGIELFKTNYNNANIIEGYDLYIYDGFIPQKLPADGNIFVINPTSENPFIEIKDGFHDVSAVEQSAHPLMSHILDYKFSVAKVKDMKIPEWGETVLRSDNVPLVIAGQKDTQKIIIIGFDLHQTDLPLKPAFPIMVSNFISWLAPSTTQEISNLSPNEPAVFNVHPETEEIRVVSPSGKSIKVAPPFPALPFALTDEIGFYTVEHKSSKNSNYHFFAVNYPAASESALMVGANSEAKNEDTGSSKERFQVGYNLSWILILLALLVFSIEWWVYNYGD